MKILILLSLSIIAVPAIADQSVNLKSRYIENYAKEVMPTMRIRMKERMPDLEPDLLNFILETTTKKMANCAYDSLEHYPDTYRKLSISSIASGVTLQDSTSKVEALMLEDIGSGVITQQKVNSIVELAHAKIKSCMKA
ncbi:hypothetical protein L4C38_15590 [Vibrio kasasachensis]|uniref:hypothetical protein n=1 Tax=Vibrio kasasachensis TaxID=2910248 RepID=UPI003D0B6BA2